MRWKIASSRGRWTLLARSLVVAGLFVGVSACGGGGGGADGAGRGLSLLSFLQASTDNVTLNTRLELVFSEAVDAASVTAATLQVREGPSFGATVSGSFSIEGSRVYFEPRLAGRCDHSDSGFKPGTNYRVQCIGHPEEFSIRNTAGQALETTQTFSFTTRHDTDPARYDDQIPGTRPLITTSAPVEGSEGVPVADGNRVVLDVSENLDPCTVSTNTVTLYMYETGDKNIFAPSASSTLSGFSDDGTPTGSTADQTPLDPYTWGALGTTTLSPPQRVLATVELNQTFFTTQISIAPESGSFPENALLVVEVSAGVRDYGGQLMDPFVLSFTTENLAGQSSTYVVENEGETPWDDALSTAEINTPRSLSRVQGYMLFAGDGDNGPILELPTLPETPASGCLNDRQVNDGTPDHFDPTGDMLFDTGASDNTCPNQTDGSTAVVWEFSTFHIRNGITVRIIGNNPAIFLVQGDVTIDSGGRLSASSDNAGGSPRGDGQNGYAWTSYATAVKYGGIGVAGAGNGGDSTKFEGGQSGKNGRSAFGSADGRDVDYGEGAGQGGTAHDTTYPSSPGTAQGGGGGGHGEEGGTSTNILGPTHKNQGPTRGAGGEAYPTGSGSERMLTPSAGGGGGGGGNEEWDGSYDGIYSTGGGAGGAGGGFLDITSSGDIFILGTIDVSGARGGNGGTSNYYAGPGGGGGGAGGGVRLLTPNEIILSASATITAAGGAGGNSPNGASGTGGPQNHGAPGGNGRIVMEDGDSLIAGLGAATITPTEGDAGFYRGVFDPGRFKGGGLEPRAVSEVFACGAFNPSFLDPIPADFAAGCPTGSTRGTGMTAMLVEAQGFQMKPDATPDTVGTGWFTVGHFVDSGVDNAPTWTLAQPSGAQLPGGLPGDNIGLGIANLDGSEFIQLRITIYLNGSVGPFDPGPYIDQWTIRFDHDQ